MPILIDANRSCDFSPPLSNHAPEIVRRILCGRLRVVVGGQLSKELERTPLLGILVEWGRLGHVEVIKSDKIKAELTLVAGLGLYSDDPHIIALARVSGSRVLYTNDRELIEDFKTKEFISPRGKIITTRTRSHVAVQLLEKFGR